MDLTGLQLKLDHSLGVPDSLPNFRHTPGFPVYCVGQPTEEGFAKLPEKTSKDKTIWFNIRQEPVVYVNGQPCALRKKEAPHENISVKEKVEEIDGLETKLVESLQKEMKDGTLEIHRDKDNQENPLDRTDIAEAVKVESVKELSKVLSGLKETIMPGMSVVRIPFQEERPLPEACFDLIVKALAEESPSTTQCVFSSQLGRGRSSLGAVIASIVKASQMMVKIRKMVDEGVAESAWADGIIHSKFEELAPSKDNEDPLLMGEFDVIKELMAKVPETVSGKKLADKMIDINGKPPEGTGMQNLRKCIVETKYKYDASTEDKQAVWKDMVINYLERYFYIICFATYARLAAPEGFKKTFSAWLDEHKDLRDMIAAGKDKLEWYRKVDEGQVSELKSLATNYKDHMGTLVGNIYKMAFHTYADIPRGPIKDNLMRKLACKTLMEVLPQDVSDRVHNEVNTNNLAMDFDTVMTIVVG